MDTVKSALVSLYVKYGRGLWDWEWLDHIMHGWAMERDANEMYPLYLIDKANQRAVAFVEGIVSELWS